MVLACCCSPTGDEEFRFFRYGRAEVQITEDRGACTLCSREQIVWKNVNSIKLNCVNYKKASVL